MTVTLTDIEDARRLLQGIIIPTPIIPDSRLSKEIGTDVHLKAENLQKGGSFKIRGAYNKISRLSDVEKSRGVIAASAGNHAQGVALAASLNNTRSTIVLPQNAPLTKIMATKNFGGDVVLHGSTFDEAVNHSRELQEQHGYTYVHAFDDEHVIAGQGTLGLEILESVPDLSVVIVPIGGGGMISGIATAIKTLSPKTRVIGVQAEVAAWVNTSLNAGKPVKVDVGQTIADGIAIKTPGVV